MSYYNDYRKRLVGGLRKVSKYKIKPGQILTFTYLSSDLNKKTRRKYKRIVFILNTWRDPNGLKVHALNLEHIPWISFTQFIKKILITDTVALLKRRYRLVSPVSEIVNRPKNFYEVYVKKLLSTHDCYRTYKINEIQAPSIGYLNFRHLFNTFEKKDMLISRNDTIRNLQEEKIIIEKTLKISLDKVSDAQFESIVKERFGSVREFVKVYRQIEDFAVEEDTQEEIEDVSEKIR